MEPGEIKLDTRGRRTAMAEDIREMLEQSRMILELNKKILDIVHSSSNWTIQMGKLQDFDFRDTEPKVESFSEPVIANCKRKRV